MIFKSEEHLSPQELEERFELLADTAHEYAIFLVDPDGHIVCWNPGASRLFGYQSDEVVGQHFSRFFSPEDIQSGQPEQELEIARAAGRCDVVRWQYRKDGGRFWCGATLTPLFDENKHLRSFARVMHDLTDGQVLEGQKKRADDLATANRSKEEFMALLSHELRNPLAPILDALNIQREVKSADPILQQAGHVIERQVGQMVRLVDDLLDVSRITTGKLRLNKQPVELRSIVNDAVEASRHSVDARRHEFSVELLTEPIWVDADPARLEQVFVNLLNNASRYTSPGGLIRVTVEREAKEGVVRVRDNGTGIPTEMLPHIFELFTQVDATAGRSHGGLGIGLALVGTLVEMHNGRVHVTSEGLGKGSEFTVRLPTIANPPESQSPSHAGMVVPTGARLRVLIVEDDIDSGDMLCMLLRLKGHEVSVARSGQAALEVAPTFLPDVVLCDVGLPGMDGYEVARRLRETPECKDKILCALTGYTPSEADNRRLPLAGFDHHFVKPVAIETLLALFQIVRS
ncbi:MAG TPA: ATP-binding protein [Planctomycetaceae bacterium]|jgi:PAS domain S-box-containing protein|nr:ATP-binding protein [Planctomycetaceae bacterium]